MKRARAFVDERRNCIMKIMQKDYEVRVDELADELGVSLITIRRDLQYLEDRRLLKRNYGGAKASIGPTDELQMYRSLIAEYAASFVADDDTLFINSSRNALQLIDYINANNVTVITNNGKALRCNCPSGVNIILTGGELRHPKEAMVGDFTIRNLQPIFAKKTFVGCSGISAETGVTTEIFNEVSINELIIRHATQDVYVLADHTKIGKSSSFISGPIEKISHLITDEKAPVEELEKLRDKGIKVHIVKQKA